MSFFIDTYFQLFERFLAIEEKKNHFYSSRRLHRNVSAQWPAYFPQKLVRDENILLEKAFWKMFFATREVEGFWLT